MSERLLLFVSPQNTIAMNGSEFGLDETSTECILFSQMQLYNLYKLTQISLTFQLTFLLSFLTLHAF